MLWFDGLLRCLRTDADTTKSGLLSLADFEKALQVEAGNDYVGELFELFDQDGDGALRYAEFVSGLLYVNAKVSAVETARLTFRLFDKVRARHMFKRHFWKWSAKLAPVVAAGQRRQGAPRRRGEGSGGAQARRRESPDQSAACSRET